MVLDEIEDNWHSIIFLFILFDSTKFENILKWFKRIFSKKIEGNKTPILCVLKKKRKTFAQIFPKINLLICSIWFNFSISTKLFALIFAFLFFIFNRFCQKRTPPKEKSKKNKKELKNFSKIFKNWKRRKTANRLKNFSFWFSLSSFFPFDFSFVSFFLYLFSFINFQFFIFFWNKQLKQQTNTTQKSKLQL